MKLYVLEYSPRAKQDFVELYDWLLACSSTFTADTFLDGLRDACQDLERAPLRGNTGQFRGRAIRRIGYKRSVTIIFFVQDDVVRILRLLYRGRDVQHASLR